MNLLTKDKIVGRVNICYRLAIRFALHEAAHQHLTGRRTQQLQEVYDKYRSSFSSCKD
jgi:hypothetical protein